MAATTLGFIPLQLIPTNAMTQYNFEKGFPTNGTYVVVKTPTVAQQLQLTKSLKEMQSGKEVNNNEPSKPVILRCKRRVDFTGLGCKLVDSQNPSVSRRNERERKRVKMVNLGFETLRQHVPSGRKNKKMSKVETLRSAVQYIKQLQDMLDVHDSGMDGILNDKIDMSELESKVSELIQNAANSSNSNSSSNNSLDLDDVEVGDAYTSNGLMDIQNQQQQQQSHQNIQSDHLHLQQQQQQQLQHQQQLSPASTVSSQGLPHSPQQQHHHHHHHHQQQQQHQAEQFFHQYTTSAMFTDQYDSLTSDYSQASPANSLHSPTSSVVSDSSYDSVGDSATHDDDDILSGFTNWF